MLHQLRTDLRRFRLLVVAFLLLNIAAAIVERLPVFPQVIEVALGCLRLAQILGITILSLRVFLADSPAHTRSQWWTRPISRSSLLAAKVAFLAIAVWLPMLVVYLVAWTTDAFTARQIALAATELTLYVAGAAALFAGVAAISESIWGALARLAAVGIVIGLASWIAEIEGPNLDLWHVPSRLIAPAVLLGLTASGILCLAAIFTFRKPVLAYLGLAIVAITPIWMPAPDRYPDLSAPDDPKLREIKAVRPGSEPVTEGGDTPVIQGNISLANLPANHFVVPMEGEFTFSNGDTTVAHFQSVKRPDHQFIGSFNIPTFAAPTLRRHLPPGTKISTGESGIISSAIPSISRLSGDRASFDIPGHLEGKVSYFLFESIYAGQLALRRGSGVSAGAYSLILPEPRSVNMRTRTTAPNLAFSSLLAENAGGYWSWVTWIIAAYSPDTGEAELIWIQSQHMGGPFPITAHSTTAFDLERFDVPDSPHGSDISDSNIELHAFLILPQGTQSQTFAWDGHRVEADTEKIRDHILANTNSGAQAGGNATDPDTPPEKISDISTLDQLASTARLQLPFAERQLLEEHARDLFLKDIPGSLARAPWPRNVQNPFAAVIANNLTVDHLPALREALIRDPRLIAAAEVAGLGVPLRDYVIGLLSRRNPHTEPAALRIAASFQDPALYPDLRWHLIHGNRDSEPETLFPLLEKIPGSDADSALEEAWQRATLTNTQHSLWRLALAHGLPGALEFGVSQLFQTGTSDGIGKNSPTAALVRATSFSGPTEEFYPWIQKNFPYLKFDSQSKTYRVDIENSPL